MSRTNRLLTLMQLFHEHRYPINADVLAEKLKVSIRTIYRDIETLREQGVDIIGETGVGYVVKDNFALPPLMFTPQELEALILGSHWVKAYGDEELVESAKKVLAKITSVIPKIYQMDIQNNTLFVPPCQNPVGLPKNTGAPQIREAIRHQRQCQIKYQDEKSDITTRVIYPFGLAFFGDVQLIMAWCCLRQDFRHFRVDRVMQITVLEQGYQPSKHQLLHEWKKATKIKLDS